MSVSDDSFSLGDEVVFGVDSVDEGVVSSFDVGEGVVFVGKTLLGSSQVGLSESESFFSGLDLNFQLSDLVFVVGDGLVFQNIDSLVKVINGGFELIDGSNVDGGEVVQRLGEVRGQIVKGGDGNLDGSLVGGGLNLHHSLDDGLDVELVLGLQVGGGSLDLLGEGDESVLDLDQREITETGIVVRSLSILEVGDGFSDDTGSRLVVLDFSSVDLLDEVKVVLVLSQRSLVVRKSLLGVSQVSLVVVQLVVEVVQ